MFTLSRKYVGGGGERAGDGRTNRTENDKKSFSREHKKATNALDNLLHFSPVAECKKMHLDKHFTTQSATFPVSQDQQSCPSGLLKAILLHAKAGCFAAW